MDETCCGYDWMLLKILLQLFPRPSIGINILLRGVKTSDAGLLIEQETFLKIFYSELPLKCVKCENLLVFKT